MRLATSLGLFILLASPVTAAAQRGRLDRVRQYFDRDHGVELGLVGGPNRNTVTGAGPVDAKFRGSLGAYLSVPVADRLRIRPEIGVSGKLVGVDDEIASFTWLEAPLLFETRFERGFGRSWTPRLYAGPFVAIRLSCSIEMPVATPTPGSPRLVTPCDPPDGSQIQYHNGDAGFVLGGALAFGRVGIGIRWTRSLVEVAPEQTTTLSGRLIGAKQSTLAAVVEIGTRVF